MRVAVAVKDIMFSLNGEKGRLVPIYDLDELKDYPNIDEEDFEDCKECVKYWEDKNLPNEVIGFTKVDTYTDEHPFFIQVFNHEVKFIENI